jgi:hypothetical protein
MTMTTISDIWNDAYDLLGESASKSAVEQLLGSVERCEGSNWEKSLLRGYIGYQFPCAATTGIDVRYELESALELEPGNTTACLYLSHYHYDTRSYGLAISYLERIDVGKYVQAGQVWRALKILEMKLAAQIHLSVSRVNPDEVLNFVRKLRSSGAESVAVPLELVQALVASKSELARIWTEPTLRKVVLDLRSSIDEIAGVTTLKEETDALLR